MPFDPESGLILTRTLGAGLTHSANSFERRKNTAVHAIDFTGLDGSSGGLIYELGGVGSGSYCGFRADGTFIFRGGNGGTPWDVNTAYIEIPGGATTITGDGTLVTEFDYSSGSLRLRAWWNGVELGTPVDNAGFATFSGSNLGGVLILGDDIVAGEVTSAVAYTTSSGLRIYGDQVVAAPPPSGVSGTLVVQEAGSDVFVGSGTVASTGVDGTLSVQESGSDLMVATGTVTVLGTLSAQETGSDTFTASGSIEVVGSLSVQEAGSDVAAVTGTIEVAGSFSVQETGSDVFTGAGSVGNAVSGNMAAQESGSDVFVGSASVAISGTLSVQELGQDVFSSTGELVVSGILSTQETGSDNATGLITITVSGSMAAQEAGNDTFLAYETAPLGQEGTVEILIPATWDLHQITALWATHDYSALWREK